MRRAKVEIKIKEQWQDVAPHGYLVKCACCTSTKKYTLQFQYESLEKIPNLEPRILETQMRITIDNKVVFIGHCIGFDINFITAKFEFQDYSYWLESFAKEQTYKLEKISLSKAIEKILISNGKHGIDMDISKEIEINKELKVEKMTILEVLEMLAKECGCNLYFAIGEDTQQPVLRISSL